MEFSNEWEKLRKVVLAVYFAVLLTVLSLLGVSHMGLITTDFGEDRDRAAFRTALWLIVAGEIVFLAWLKKMLISREVIFRQARKIKLLPKIVKGGHSVREVALGTAVSFYFFGNLLAFAVSESIGLLGFFLAYLAAFHWDHYLLTLVALLFLIVFYPSRSFFGDLVEYEPL